MVLSYANNSEAGGSETDARGAKLLIMTKYAPPPPKKKHEGGRIFFSNCGIPN